MIRFLLLSFLAPLLLVNLQAQSPIWTDVDETTISVELQQQRDIVPNVYRTVSVKFVELQGFLKESTNIKKAFSQISLPMPDGTETRFEIEISNVFSAGLAEKYPSIKLYRGKAADGSVAHFGYSKQGFHAMILRPQSSSVFIDKFARNNEDLYISYFRKDYDRQSEFECLVEDVTNELESTSTDSKSQGDCQLRHYRLALACTGEYANFHGGTVETVLEEYAIAMSRVVGIYERDNGITMSLIENTDEVIFLNGATDPYTNNNGGAMLGQNQETLDDIIGLNNYDIGHVFSTGGGGIASLQSPCGNGKARGVTGLNSPVNDPFYVDYVSHEIGHQFGANHTQNNSCNRNGSTAMEPGSANTIMGYAGICAPNTANNSDDHFHAISVQEIANFIVGGNGANCAEILDSDNSQPEVSVESETYVLPIGTPFVLTAIATDDDNDSLTYCWEQMDNEIATMPPSNVSTEGPAFLSIPPQDSPSRYFPNLIAILTNTIPTWEVIPFVSRDMSFRCTVRDNHGGLGCTDEVDVDLEFSDDAGPFVVLAANGGEMWMAGETEMITWDVASTDVAPVSCELVDIFLSIDAGLTYPIQLASSVPNDGSQVVTVPGVQATFARVMVKCATNIFFDISDANFTISTPFSLNASPTSFDLCEGQEAIIEITTEGFNGFGEEITFELPVLPGSTTASFSANPIAPGESTTLTLSNISGFVGSFALEISAVTDLITIPQTILITSESNNVDGFQLLAPNDGAINIPTDVELFWTDLPGVNDYNFQLATDPGFINIVESFTEIEDGSITIQGLEEATVYYWRIQIKNTCAGLPFSDVNAFQTREITCESFTAEELPLGIFSGNVATSMVMANMVSPSAEVRTRVDIDHAWIGDLIVQVISPEGTPLRLFDRIGVPGSTVGCDANTINTVFTDASENIPEDLESECGNFEDTYQPLDLFANLDGEDLNGVWTIEISDMVDFDNGTLEAWSMEFCTEEVLEESDIKKNIFALSAGSGKIIENVHLEIKYSDPQTTRLYIMTPTIHGVLEQDLDQDGTFEILEVGQLFTQDAINQNLIRYTHNGNDATADAFLFDVIDSEGRWRHNEVFDIIINQGDFAAYALLINEISCFGESTGIVNVEVFDDCPDYTYVLNGMTQSTPLFTNLGAGTYELIVSNSCSETTESSFLTITEPAAALTAQVLNEGYDLVVDAQGGSSGYLFSLNGIDYQAGNTFEGLDNGIYDVYILDGEGCELVVQATVNVEVLTLIVEVDSEILCFGDETVTITISGSGGLPDYEYSLNGQNFQDESIFEFVGAGVYDITIRDAGGFTSTQQITITEPEQLTFTYEFQDDILTILATGGTGSLRYSVDGVEFKFENTFDSYPLSPMIITVSDDSECFAVQSAQALFYTTDVEEITCDGENDGEIEVEAIGGNPGYTYALNGGDEQTDNVFTDLSPGIYNVLVRDQNNNSYQSQTNITLVEPEVLDATTSFMDDQIVVTATGGIEPYIYSFNGGSSFQTSNIKDWDGADSYELIVRDDRGCTIQTTVVIVGTKEFATGEVEIYPNPVLDNVVIETGQIGSSSLRIVNNLGQILLETSVLSNTSKEVDMSNYSDGIYHVIIQSDEKHFLKKVVKVSQ